MTLINLRAVRCALVTLVALGASSTAQAIPSFARQIDKPCSTCHTAFPRLNETGRTFRANGYRFLDDPKGQEVWEMQSLPISFEAVVQAYQDEGQDSEGVDLPTESDVQVEAVELLVGAALGETGRVSVFGAVEVAQEEADDGSTEYNSEIGPAFIQINDLLGGQGLGRLNFRAGQFDLSLPFLSGEQSVIQSDYLAQAIGVLGDGARRGLEFNGQIIAGSGDATMAHRYAVGFARTEYDGDPDRNSNLDPYAIYSVNIHENYNLGVIWKSDTEEGATPTEDQTVDRYGLGANAVFGPVEATVGYFSADPDLGPTYDDVMAEVLYYVGKQAVFGARFDQASADGAADDATAISLTARYNVLQNVALIAQYSHLSDDSNIITDNDEEEEYALILQLLM